MPWIAPVIMAAGAIGGAAIGAKKEGDARQQQRDLIEKAVKEYENIGVPPAESLQVIMEDLRSAGQLTPDLEEAINQKDSELKSINLDPRSKEAQYAALDELEQLGSGDLRLSDEAALNQAMGKIQTKGRGARDAIESSLKARGAFGSGAELASKLAANQEQAQEANQVGLGVAANAQDRALDAIIKAGAMGGDIRGQDFAEQKAIADAQDEINRFNTANRADVVRRNVDRANAAREYNLRNDQRISDANVGMHNANEVRNADLKQQEFENKLGLASGKANAYGGQANAVAKQGAADAATWGKIGQGVGQIGTSIANSSNQAKTGQGQPAPYEDSSLNQRYKPAVEDDERYYA